jgi:succinate dehydrogenase / fumarate reductase, cytochrome b subunit
MAQRPLSPHLTIWKWGPHMAVSILHRISGQGLAFVGLPVLLWWLGALASGPEAYESFASAATSPLGYVVLAGLSWAFFNHLASGIRHLVLDMGAGYEIDRNRLWSIASLALGVLLTAAFWAAIILL